MNEEVEELLSNLCIFQHEKNNSQDNYIVKNFEDIPILNTNSFDVLPTNTILNSSTTTTISEGHNRENMDLADNHHGYLIDSDISKMGLFFNDKECSNLSLNEDNSNLPFSQLILGQYTKELKEQEEQEAKRRLQIEEQERKRTESKRITEAMSANVQKIVISVELPEEIEKGSNLNFNSGSGVLNKSAKHPSLTVTPSERPTTLSLSKVSEQIGTRSLYNNHKKKRICDISIRVSDDPWKVAEMIFNCLHYRSSITQSSPLELDTESSIDSNNTIAALAMEIQRKIIDWNECNTKIGKYEM